MAVYLKPTAASLNCTSWCRSGTRGAGARSWSARPTTPREASSCCTSRRWPERPGPSTPHARFYMAMGFVPLEELPQLWGVNHACSVRPSGAARRPAPPAAPARCTRGSRAPCRAGRGPPGARPPCLNFCTMSMAVSSSSTCSAMNHWRKLYVAWSLSSSASEAMSWMRAGHSLLVGQRLLEHRQPVRPFRLRLVDRVEDHPSATREHVGEHDARVGQLLLVLHRHPALAAGHADVRELARHREVQVPRVELPVDLAVDRVLHPLVQHRRPPSPCTGQLRPDAFRDLSTLS